MDEDTSQTEGKKKKGGRGRKMNEKEILKEYTKDQQQHVTVPTGFRSRSGSVSNVLNKVEALLVETSTQTVLDKMPKPKNVRQEDYVRSLKNRDKKIVFATGPAGTGKTMLACSYGIAQLVCGVYDKLIFTRPLIAVDEEIGFLPGTMEEKMAPWVRPMMDVLSHFLTQREIQVLQEEKVIEIVPLGFMRGRTFVNTWVIADEMQNATVNQMKMLTTRIGSGSRMVITGDLDQCDLPMPSSYRTPRVVNGLADFLSRMQAKGCPNTIAEFAFDVEDVQREEVVKDVLKMYA